MSAQDVVNKAIEAVNQHDANAFAALYDPEAVATDPQYSEPLYGREAIRRDIEDFFVAFPDLQATVSNTIVNGDTVAFEVELIGTHRGPIISPEGNIPATNQPVKLAGARFVRVNEKDMITECRRYYDMAGLVQQLGIM